MHSLRCGHRKKRGAVNGLGDGLASGIELSADLVSDLFDAAVDDARWGSFASIIARALGMDQAAVVVGRDSPNLDISVTPNILEIMATYDLHYQSLDPWAERRRFVRPGTVALANEFLPESLLFRTEFYNDYARKIGMLRPLTADLTLEGGLRLEIGAEQPFARSPADETDKQNLARLAPYIARAIALRQRTGRNRLDIAIGRALLHAWSFAALVCDAGGRVILANAAAEEMDAKGVFPLPRSSDHTGVLFSESRSVIGKFVAEVAAGGSGGHASLRGPTGAVILASVSPLPAVMDLPAGLALVTLRAIAERSFGVAELRAFFALSQSQAELALALYDGMTIETFAAQRNVKLSTLRTHLSEVFIRTGTVSQRDLVRLLGQIPPLARKR